jgi:hypothetical protein
MRKFVFILALLPLVTGCLATRNFRDPKERPRKDTAYTLPHKQFQAGLTLLGQNPYDFVLGADFAAGIGDRWEVGVNLAHAVFGVMNVYGKYNFIDKKWWAMGATLGVTWIHVKSVWAIPEKYRDALGNVDILSIPIEIHSSFPVADWVGLHLSAGYLHSQFFGKINEETLFLDGDIGSHQVYLRPNITLYIAERIQVFLAARLLLWGGRYGEVAAEATNNDDLIIGFRSTGFNEFEFGGKSFIKFGVEAKFGKYTYLRLWAVYNGSVSNSNLFSTPILPGLDLYWRF